ncbi:MAG: hypothetical protein HC939_13925 [Pleurocapsa sp. SU_5_0]|nr:hypothetical protein [Pleurocapsa sp. SU_5_0]NJO97518.1 hypothetical protein [Pleurocapsa sp. CRU_1_2]
MALKEFNWNDWLDQALSIGSVGYWVKEFEIDYFNRKEKNDRTLTTWNTDYKSMLSRLNKSESLSERVLIELIKIIEPWETG